MYVVGNPGAAHPHLIHPPKVHHRHPRVYHHRHTYHRRRR